jgi:hypothetical protein
LGRGEEESESGHGRGEGGGGRCKLGVGVGQGVRGFRGVGGVGGVDRVHVQTGHTITQLRTQNNHTHTYLCSADFVPGARSAGGTQFRRWNAASRETAPGRGGTPPPPHTHKKPRDNADNCTDALRRLHCVQHAPCAEHDVPPRRLYTYSVCGPCASAPCARASGRATAAPPLLRRPYLDSGEGRRRASTRVVWSLEQDTRYGPSRVHVTSTTGPK